MSIKRSHFLNELLQKHNIPSAYKALHYEFNSNLFFEADNDQKRDILEDKFCEVHIAFPGFIKPTFRNSGFKTKKINQKYQDSFGIIITPETTDISQYLNTHFSKSSRAPIIKKMKRLESCFNIQYKVFYGAITKKEYNQIMDRTHAMLVSRFDQRNDNTFILNDWNTYLELLFPLINEKKASLFVIYNEDAPIQVSINFHYKKTFFAYIPAYDIDYAQFGLGNTAVYKQLEWCIENNYEYLDMGNGDYDYKKRWCNYHYLLETHIHYNSSNLKANILAIKEINTIKIKNKLKDVFKSTLYNKFQEFIFKTRTENNKSQYSNYSFENLETLGNYNEEHLEVINLNSSTNFTYLKKPLFDFIYTAKEHMDNVGIYSVNNEKDTFLIKGKTSILKVGLNQKGNNE